MNQKNYFDGRAQSSAFHKKLINLCVQTSLRGRHTQKRINQVSTRYLKKGGVL